MLWLKVTDTGLSPWRPVFSPCQIYDGQSGTGTGFITHLRKQQSLCSLHKVQRVTAWWEAVHLPSNTSLLLHLCSADLDIWYFGACSENCQVCLIVVHLGQKKTPTCSSNQTFPLKNKIALHTGNL